jgi:hypothetical protein
MNNTRNATKKVAYVAGPYRDSRGQWFVHQNIESARRVSAELWARGYAVICPHSNTAHFDGVCDDQSFLDGLIDIMLRCDLVVLAPNWQNSSGTHAEIDAAKQSGIPVFEWPDLEHAVWCEDE